MKRSELEQGLTEFFIEQSKDWAESNYSEVVELSNRDSIYSGIYTVFLMIKQKSIPNQSMAATVQAASDEIKTTRLDAWLGDSRRRNMGKPSNNPGAFCQARKRLDVSKVEDLHDAISGNAESEFSKDSRIFGYRPYILDGSLVDLANTESLKSEFSTYSNARGALRPAARILVAHNAVTATALRPEIGAITDSEQKLTLNMLARMPKDALIMGDSNFGTFLITSTVKSKGLDSLVRLQEMRALKILGKKSAVKDGDYPVTWEASPREIKKHSLQSDASINGRVLVITDSSAGKRAQKLYFFTNTKLSSEQVLGIYTQRWFIETDLRTLKEYFNLDRLYSKTPDLVRKEILASVLAYTMQRTLIMRACKRLSIKPRQISFKRACGEIKIAASHFKHAKSALDLELAYQNFFTGISQCKLPNRTKRRVEPRATVEDKNKFPVLKISRQEARTKIIKDLDA